MFKKITRRNLEEFLKRYATKSRVLDVGSGGSSYQKFFPNRVTVDIDPNREPDVIGDAHALPFKDGEFETVLCTEVLEHVKNPFDVEKEFWRVLKPGGILVLSTRFIFPIHDAPNDFWRFTRYGLKMIFKQWEIIELTDEAATFSTLAVLLQRISFQTRLRANAAIKLFLFVSAWVLDHTNGLVIEEYGDIKKTRKEYNILSSGYYLACRKKL
ncbi:MAG: class I SAM-dependent methyltransferase [Patescibacteria group bacterium]